MAESVDEVRMTLTVTNKRLLDRLQAAVVEFDPEEEITVMEPVWDAAASTDRALRACVFDNSMAAIGSVKKRHRSAALEGIAAATFEGYMIGRYLLGTGTVQPSYSRTDKEVVSNATHINERGKAYSFDDVMSALNGRKADGGNKTLIELVGAMRARFPLQGMMKQEKSDALFLASYCLGISLALAEEEIFSLRELIPDNSGS
jgi:hypothetical protein